MDIQQGIIRFRQEHVNEASDTPKENGVRVSEKPRSLTSDGTRVDAPLLSATHRTAIESPVNISTDHLRSETAGKAATAPIPETGDLVSVLSADETTSSAPLKKPQSVEHISWMERRISTLEEELRSFRHETLWVFCMNLQFQLTFRSKRDSIGQQHEKEAEASHDEFDRGQKLETRIVKLDEFRDIKKGYEVTQGNVILCAKAERREVSVQISAEKETSE